MEGTVTEETFISILMLDGEGTITADGETISCKKGDSLFLPASTGDYKIEGTCDALITSIRENAGMVRIGINVTENGTITRKVAQKRVFEDKMYLYPIPEGEYWKTNIENNPGW